MVDVKKRKKSKPPVATRAAGHVEFIDKVFGGKLYPFRGYRVKPETPGKMSAPAPESSSNLAVPPPVAPPG